MQVQFHVGSVQEALAVRERDYDADLTRRLIEYDWRSLTTRDIAPIVRAPRRGENDPAEFSTLYAKTGKYDRTTYGLDLFDVMTAMVVTFDLPVGLWAEIRSHQFDPGVLFDRPAFAAYAIEPLIVKQYEAIVPYLEASDRTIEAQWQNPPFDAFAEAEERIIFETGRRPTKMAIALSLYHRLRSFNPVTELFQGLPPVEAIARHFDIAKENTLVVPDRYIGGKRILLYESPFPTQPNPLSNPTAATFSPKSLATTFVHPDSYVWFDDREPKTHVLLLFRIIPSEEGARSAMLIDFDKEAAQ